MSEFLAGILASLVALFGGGDVLEAPIPELGGPTSRLERTMIPEADSTYFLGTSSPSVIAWARVVADSFFDSDASDGCATFSSNLLTSTGVPCGSGGGSGGGTWSTTTSQVAGTLINYPNNATDVVAIGSNATTSAEFWFDPNTLQAVFGTGSAGDSSLTFGPNTNNQWIMGYDDTDKSFAIASSSALGTQNVFSIAKGGTASTSALIVSTLNAASCDVKASSSGVLSCGTDATGGGGSGSISTSSPGVVSSLAYFTTAGATPELVAPVATTTLTATGPLSLSNTVAKVGGSNSVLTLATTTNNIFSGTGGNILAYSNALGGYFPQATSTMNVGTASALFANGSNCSAGSFPLGVDASGVVETCTDAWTEAENTAAAYTPQSRTLTIAGTSQQITSSAGAQDLSANRTWTLSLPSHVVFPGSINAGNSTTTNATSTSLAVLNLTSASCDVKASTSGVLSCGTDAVGGGSGGTGNVATSTNEVANQVAVFTSNSATPALIGGDSDFTFLTDRLTITNASSTRLTALQEAKFGATATSSFDSAGVPSFPLTGLLQGTGAGSNVTAITNSSTGGQVLRVTGASTYAWGALDLADTDAITGDLPFANLTQGAANTVLANTTGATADFAALATSSLFAGSNGQVLARVGGTWVGTATTTAGTGLTYTGSAFNVNTSQNISTLSNLTTNGFVRTSGGTGALSVQTDPCTYAMGCTGSTTAPVSQILYGGASAFQSVATTSSTIGGSLSYSGTFGALVGGVSGTLSLNMGNANTWTALQTFGNSSTTLASFSYASSTAWFGGGLNTDCDTAATSKLLWDITTGKFSCGTDQNSGGGSAPNSKWATSSASTVSIHTAEATRVGIGTTTPGWSLQLASSTSPQLALSDGSATSFHWTWRSINSNLYLATSSPSTFATSSRPILFISSSGTTTISGVGAATSTQYVYSTGSGKGGSIIMEDMGGGACTELTTKGGVLSAAVVTCPTEL